MKCRVCKAPLASSNRPPAGTKRHAGRGLCARDYRAAERRGDLCDYPPIRRTRTAEEFLEDYDWLRRSGCTWHEAADRMGMEYGVFERAIYRAREKGDPRAFRRVRRGDNHANRAAPIMRDDLLAAYVPLRDSGLTLRQCADRIGVPYQQFRRSLGRARQAGDPRAERVKEVA